MTGAEIYTLFVETIESPVVRYTNTFTTLGGQVDNLTPSTIYNCYIKSSNSAGTGTKSITKTIRTCKYTYCEMLIFIPEASFM